MAEKAWDKRPEETSKAYAAFQIYLSLSPFGEGSERRNIPNVAAKLGLRSTTSLDSWSSPNEWVRRAQAYDAVMGNSAIEVKVAAITEYRQAVETSLSSQLVVMNQILEKALSKLNRQMDLLKEDEAPPLSAIKRMAEAIILKDNAARRLGGMPTQYTVKRVDEEDFEDETYVIGG